MLCNQSSRLYCDADEIEALKRLLLEEADGRSELEQARIGGAYLALRILSTQKLMYPHEFMTVFRAMAFNEYETKDKDTRESESE